MNEHITAVEKALCALENGEIKEAEKSYQMNTRSNRPSDTQEVIQ